jgi:hypothetical protein
MSGDIVRIDLEVEMPTGFGFDAEQLTHMLVGRCHILGLEVRAAGSATVGIYNEDDE